MSIPPEADGTFEQGGVKFVIEYLGAGQHQGWSSSSGFYEDAPAFDWDSEMLCRIEAPNDQELLLLLITKDGQRKNLDPAISRFVRIPKPLLEIDHFESGFHLYEKKKDEWHPETMCTVTIEAFVPENIQLSPTFLSCADAAELKTVRGNGMTFSTGAVMSSIHPMPLNDVGSVAVSLKIRNVNE